MGAHIVACNSLGTGSHLSQTIRNPGCHVIVYSASSVADRPGAVISRSNAVSELADIQKPRSYGLH